MGISSSAIGLKIRVINAQIKKYKSLIKKHDKLLLQAKSELKIIEVLISKALINSNTSHDELDLINNIPKEFDDLKEEIKNYNYK